MSVKVNFRVVGLYCSLPGLRLARVTPKSTVKDIMLAIQADPASNFKFVEMQVFGNKLIVDSMSYKYVNGQSNKPLNSSPTIQNGTRSLKNQLQTSPVAIWQYYRSVTGTINGTKCELKLFTKGQPSYALTALDANDPALGTLPQGFIIDSYNLTWRLVRIEMHPKQLEKLQSVKQINTVYES
jgi:hypothetical protein